MQGDGARKGGQGRDRKERGGKNREVNRRKRAGEKGEENSRKERKKEKGRWKGTGKETRLGRKEEGRNENGHATTKLAFCSKFQLDQYIMSP